MHKQPLLWRLSHKHQILLIKQLAMLLRSGIPLLMALHILRDQHTKSKTLYLVMSQVADDVENGQPLSAALEKYKKVFGGLTVTMIAIGEISGTLSDSLDHLAASLKKKQALQHKLVAASVYPAFVVVATLAITVLLTVVIFPKIIPVFTSVHYRLPWTTRALIVISAILQHHLILVILLLVAVGAGIWLLLKLPTVRKGCEYVLLLMPFCRPLIQDYSLATTFRTIGILIGSGTTAVQSIKITAGITTHPLYQQALDSIANHVANGKKLSGGFSEFPKLFPVSVVHLIAVGESTGKLGETCLYLADHYEQELDELTKNLSATVEPLLLICMGLMVGFIAIAIITPIYGITQHLNTR